jgi:ribosome-binding protein aMBF1 (putative translation factor)
MAFLAFVRMGHYWTLTHREIEVDADMERLLRANKELARLLLDDPEAHRATPGRRPAAELTTERPAKARHRGRKTGNLDWHVAGQVHLQRVRHGLSLNQLAGRVGISPQQLFKYEQGTNRITVARLYVIAQELGVSIGSFFRGFRDDER